MGIIDKIQAKIKSVFRDKNAPALPPPPPPKYKLVHHGDEDNVTFLRWLFIIADQEFDDVNIKSKEEWDNSEYHDKSPFGQLPLLEIEGKERVCSSLAIARYLAREFGFTNGISHLDEAKLDMIVGSIDENKRPVEVANQIDDESKRECLLKEYRDEKLPEFLAKLENYLEKNGGRFLQGLEKVKEDIIPNGGVNVSEIKEEIEEKVEDLKDGAEDLKEEVEEKAEDFLDTVTALPDLAFASFSKWLDDIKATPDWEKFPRLSGLKQKVERNPKIIEWGEKIKKAEQEVKKEIEQSQKKKK